MAQRSDPEAKVREIRRKTYGVLKEVGLAHKIHQLPPRLSGGEQQRVCIARAIANNPTILLADEPTGNLDSKSGQEIMAMLHELNKEGKTIIVVTHDSDVAGQAHCKIEMKDGNVTDGHRQN